MFVQPQKQYSNLSDVNAVTVSDLILGDSSLLVSEFVFIGKIVIRYTAANWRFVSVTKLTGTKVTQVGSPAGIYLSAVNTDSTITGDGTVANPIGTTHSLMPDKNSEAAFQHVDTTTVKTTLAEADKVALYDSVTGKVVLSNALNDIETILASI